MKRVAKPAGQFNIVIEEAPIPEPNADEVRVRAVRSLISRGSEIGARYTRKQAIDPERMGYSMAGIVDKVGAEIDHLQEGDRVVAQAPHAQYVVRSGRSRGPRSKPNVIAIPDDLDFEAATYLPLAGGAVTWTHIEKVNRFDSVVILGQGLVGSLMLQVGKANGRGRYIAVDTLERRCALAEELGADHVINAANQDPVKAVLKLTDGVGANIVVYAVGGPAGLTAFDQGLDMLAIGGLMHLIGLYEDQPLPLSSAKIQGRRLLGGYFGHEGSPVGHGRRAFELLTTNTIQTQRMTSHRFPYMQAAEAFDLLYNNLSEAMGVILDWESEKAATKVTG